MQKEAFYFPHFSNARHDRKIRRLRKELGIEGYGIYFMLLETLRDQHDMMYPIEDCDLLAEEFGTSDAKIKTVISSYELFDFDEDGKFFSPKMLVYLEPYFKMKEQRIIAGKASAAKRLLNDRSTTVQQSKVKESKVKESKVNESKEDIGFIIDKSIIAFKSYHECYREELGSEFDSFMNYWTEPNPKNGKLRWEMEKFFDIKRRIATWMNNATKFAPNKPQQQLGKLQQNMISLKNVHDELTEQIENGTFINPYK
jgi:hypothetical protein